MTVKEIAELAGVSTGTVDRVLHGRGRVAPETEKTITAIVEKHQYVPNTLARSLKRSRPYRFYAVVPRREQDSHYWNLAIQGIQEASEEFASLGVETKIIEYDHLDTAGFKKTERKVLEGSPDGVVFPPIYPQVSRPFIEKLENLRIPYVFFDSDMPETRPVCTIETDSFKGGYLAGKLLHLFAGEITGTVLVQWAPLNYHIRGRREGFLCYAREHGFASLVKSCPDDNGTIPTDNEIAAILRKQRNLQGVFVAYADVRLAAEMVKTRKKSGNVCVVGYDLVPGNYELLKEKRIDAIISQRSHEQGRQALFSLYRHIILGWKIEAKIEMPLDVYFAENLPEVYPSRPYRIKQPSSSSS